MNIITVEKNDLVGIGLLNNGFVMIFYRTMNILENVETKFKLRLSCSYKLMYVQTVKLAVPDSKSTIGCIAEDRTSSHNRISIAFRICSYRSFFRELSTLTAASGEGIISRHVDANGIRV